MELIETGAGQDLNIIHMERGTGKMELLRKDGLIWPVCTCFELHIIYFYSFIT